MSNSINASSSDTAAMYLALRSVLDSAYTQAAYGKGAVRHSDGATQFEDQPICTITRQVGLGFPLGQAVKKIYEIQNIQDPDARTKELYGAINYIAAAIIIIDEQAALNEKEDE